MVRLRVSVYRGAVAIETPLTGLVSGTVTG